MLNFKYIAIQKVQMHAKTLVNDLSEQRHKLNNTLTLVILVFFRRKGEPSLVRGNILWGSGQAFKENAVKFIHTQQAKHGDIFTI